DIDLSDYDREWLKKLGELEAVAEKEAFILKAIEEEPNSAFRYLELGRLYAEESQQFLQARTAYDKAIELDPKSPKAWNYLGILLGKPGSHTEEEQAYRKA